jgi:hypothetical protein
VSAATRSAPLARLIAMPAAMALPVGIFALLALMVLPIPALLLDIFFVLNIAISIAVLMVALNARRPLDFSSFPSVLLFATLLRLALNVASTRVVLVHGHEGGAAAGHVIESFAAFLVGGNFAVGLFVFAILMIINMIVITKGAGRVSEVSARFVLDALPGKQMAIDADIAAGLITADAARERRREVTIEADFYGSMDGASKFVKGDAVAALLILGVNIVAGFALGMVSHDMSAAEAGEAYVTLAVGDALVAQSTCRPSRLMAGISNEKAALARAPRFHSWTVQTGKPVVANNAPADEATTGPMALADIDGDGQLDLLVGARARAGRYPETSPTVILPGRTDGWGEAQLVTDQVRASGAVFTDTDGDGDPDLVLAGDWDTLRFFRNDGGRWVDATAESGLGAWRGLWNGVNAGDFDGDGRLDLVASNWGRNWRTDQPGASNAPIQMVYGEFHEPGRVLTLMASWDPLSGRQTPWRSWSSLSQAIPALTERAHSHREFAVLSVDSLLGPLANRGRTLNAETFDSMVFLNRGGRFEGVPLAVEAQFSPSFGISIADFDGDGCEDLFLAQNFFGMDVETSRQDAGAGLVLLGDGRGHFRSLGPREAGFSLPGEQRGSAVADVDADGRPDLAVGQQSGKTRILRNRAGKPGVRVALEGPAGNPDGIGAAVRLVMGSRLGPVREIHAGAGFRSQDSPEILLATPQDPTAVEVRWPGGKVQRSEWPVGARSVVMSAEGLRRR